MKFVNHLIIAVFTLTLSACGETSTEQVDSPEPESLQQPDSSVAPVEAETTDVVEILPEPDQSGIKLFNEKWTGDLDALVDRRVIRVLTVYGMGRYYLDGSEEKGVTYELFRMFEEFLNKKLATGLLKVHVVFIPVGRDQLVPGLISGRGDIAAAGLTITPERDELIDFSDPASKVVSEVLVTGPAAPKIDTIKDLAGRKIYVRESSSYRASLDALNLEFQQQGLEAIEIENVAEMLEDEDLLDMVNTGLLEWAVVDDYKAAVWTDVFENITVRDDIVLRSGGRIGFAMRANSPQLASVINEFLQTHKVGTLKGNIVVNRYLKDFDWAKNALAANDYQRFKDVAAIFSKYGEQYGIDYLMVMAQGYQESQLDQTARSSAGAIGIMQLLPSTAADSNVGIPDIHDRENNIHAGIKYLDFIRNRYFSDPEMTQVNKTLFSFAAYNAGPARIRKLRNKAAEQGYDPNVWFDNVEVMAAKDIGRETVEYVANIIKYYVAYSLSVRQELEHEQAREKAGIE